MLCQWSLYPQTDLESENGPESLLRRWLTCIKNLPQVCHNAQGYSHSDYYLWDPLLRGRKFTFYLNTFTTTLEIGLRKHPHFTGEETESERLSSLVKVTQPAGSWDWNSVFCSQHLSPSDRAHTSQEIQTMICAGERNSQRSLFFFFPFQVPAAAYKVFSYSMQALSWGMQDLVSWPGIKPGPPALGARSLNHWATKRLHFHLGRMETKDWQGWQTPQCSQNVCAGLSQTAPCHLQQGSPAPRLGTSSASWPVRSQAAWREVSGGWNQNHPTPTTGSGKNCLPQNWFLVANSLGTADLKAYPWWTAIHCWEHSSLGSNEGLTKQFMGLLWPWDWEQPVALIGSQFKGKRRQHAN